MFHEIVQGLSREVSIEGSPYLFFSGTSYLGLASNTDFNNYLKKNIALYGSSLGISRNGNLRIDVFLKAEKKLANFVNAPAALTLSSGMLVGQLVVQALKQKNIHFIYAPSAHPANWHEPLVELPSCSFLDWTLGLNQSIDQLSGDVVVVLNSIDALKLSFFSLDFIYNLPANRNITLLIDDSHGLGVMNNGRSIFSQVPPHINLVVVSSLHKAFGIPGGVVFGSFELINSLSNTTFFSACSPIPPFFLATYLDFFDRYPVLNKKLKTNVSLFLNGISDLSIFSYHKDHCIFYTKHSALYEFLFKQKIFIYNFAYPDPFGKPNTRIVLSAWHSEDDILLLIKTINSFIETL